MARRATLDRDMPRDGMRRDTDDDSAAAGEPPARSGWASQQPDASGDPDGRPGGRRPGGTPWRGSGGRWLVWTLRVVVWVILLVIGYRGVLAIVAGPSASAPSAPAPSPAPSAAFPVTGAEAYALQFGSAYLNFSPATSASRAGLLGSMLPAGVNPQLGWNGAGTQTLQSEQVSSISVKDAHHAIVTLLAEINNSQLIQLGVPVYTAGGQFVVTGEPALLPAPRAAAAPARPAGPVDAAAVSQLTGQLPAFFRAYANGSQDTLSRFLMPGAQVAGLRGAVAYNQLVSVTAPPGGTTRRITAVVSWKIPTSTQTTVSGTRKHPVTHVSAASVEMTYAMTVVEQNGTWYVQSVSSSPQEPGPP